MARTLNFKINGCEYSAEPVKIERKKLYGWTELVVTDVHGNNCRRVSLNSDGTTIIDKGAIKLGMVDEAGSWIMREQLMAVNSNGEQIEKIRSSFETGCILDTKASVEELLAVNISSVYELSGDDSTNLATEIGKDIYRIDFNYRSEYSADPAYILSTSSGLFLLVGRPIEIEFIGLEQTGVIEDEEDTEFEDGDIDFSLM